MKECDISGVKTYSDSSYIRPPNLRLWFTRIHLCHQAVQFGTGQRAVMLCAACKVTAGWAVGNGNLLSGCGFDQLRNPYACICLYIYIDHDPVDATVSAASVR